MQNRILEFFDTHYPKLRFVDGDMFRWNPRENFVEYIEDDSDDLEPALLLLHEAGHALLDHTCFNSDMDLLRKEVHAWDEAEKLAPRIGISFDPLVVENCLDTYRHWLDKRSSCPGCHASGYQDFYSTYRCINCHSQWRVSESQASRVCRITVKATV